MEYMDIFNITHEGSSEPERNATVEISPPHLQQYIGMFHAISIIIICGIIWILTGLVVNGVRKKKWTSSNQNNLDGRMIYTVCVITVASTLPRLFLSQFLFYPGKFSNCQALARGGAVAYGIVICQIYVFLWLRRRAICNHPNVTSYVGTCYQVTSYVTLIAIWVMGIGGLATYFIIDSHALSEYGCRYVAVDSPFTEIYQLIPRLALSVSVILLQLTLLALFIYPMWKIRRIAATRLVDTSNREGRFTLTTVRDTISLFCLSNSRYDIVSSTIARSITGTVITIVTDTTVALLVSITFPDDVPSAISAVMYDFGLLICIFGLLMTFQDKRRIFFVFCFRTKQLPSKSSHASITRNATRTNTKLNECTAQESGNSLALVDIT